MKTDHFALFRRQHVEVHGSAGSMVANFRNSNEIKDSPPNGPATKVKSETVAPVATPRDATSATKPIYKLVAGLQRPKVAQGQPDSASATAATAATNKGSHTRGTNGWWITPDSRQPLIGIEIRTKIEAIEAEARRLGWPAELLWNGGHYWDLPRGLAAVLGPSDEIVEVTSEAITILRWRRDVLRFRRHVA